MKILKAFFTSLLILAIVAGLSFLISREVLLMMATNRVQQSLKWIRDINNNQQYATDCMSKGSRRDQLGAVHYTQLRFIKPDSYVVEVICNGREHNPIEITDESLPPFVNHEVGYSGFRWGQDQAINFNCWNRTASVSVIEGVVHSSLKPAQMDSKIGPPSFCRAYGYNCCDPNSQQGHGAQISAALDCPKTCYIDCKDRPLVLNFSSQPYYDKLNRTVNINSGQSVTFSFTVSPNQEPVLIGYFDEDDRIEKAIATIESIFRKEKSENEVQVVLDYGDGQREKFDSLRGQIVHEYHCAQSQCNYTADLMVFKDNGVRSVDTLQNKIKIKVN